MEIGFSELQKGRWLVEESRKWGGALLFQPGWGGWGAICLEGKRYGCDSEALVGKRSKQSWDDRRYNGHGIESRGLKLERGKWASIVQGKKKKKRLGPRCSHGTGPRGGGHMRTEPTTEGQGRIGFGLISRKKKPRRRDKDREGGKPGGPEVGRRASPANSDFLSKRQIARGFPKREGGIMEKGQNC